jgi:hypothetical protein
LIHDYYDIRNAEMKLVVAVTGIDPVVVVEMTMMELVHTDLMVVDIVYLMPAMIDHVVIKLVEKMELAD